MMLVYRRPHGKNPGVGDLTDVRIGDAVTYRRDNGDRTSRVAKVSIPAQRLRTEAFMSGSSVLRPALTLLFDEILAIHRKEEPPPPPVEPPHEPVPS